jgi:hypothetical protein
MKERKTITKALAEQYRRAKKKQKGQILEQLVEATGYNRHYAAWVLRWHGKRVEFKPKVVLEGSARPARPVGAQTHICPRGLAGTKKVWEMLDYPTVNAWPPY